METNSDIQIGGSTVIIDDVEHRMPRSKMQRPSVLGDYAVERAAPGVILVEVTTTPAGGAQVISYEKYVLAERNIFYTDVGNIEPEKVSVFVARPKLF